MSTFKRSFITWTSLLAGFAVFLNWPQRVTLMPYDSEAGFPWPFAIWYGKWPEISLEYFAVDLLLWTFVILAAAWAWAWARERAPGTDSAGQRRQPVFYPALAGRALFWFLTKTCGLSPRRCHPRRGSRSS